MNVFITTIVRPMILDAVKLIERVLRLDGEDKVADWLANYR